MPNPTRPRVTRGDIDSHHWNNTESNGGVNPAALADQLNMLCHLLADVRDLLEEVAQPIREGRERNKKRLRRPHGTLVL